ncbi:hypothetical protein CDAR_585451 [Caerostris darwini]|uniref:Secreted protein n=1 Tax=Caerostris darwini TaxID=1538125 RepID=A0AAV4X102_9ARAC|nr:hypothetical protein CDAR_585451 [Caerostris darwini]
MNMADSVEFTELLFSFLRSACWPGIGNCFFFISLEWRALPVTVTSQSFRAPFGMPQQPSHPPNDSLFRLICQPARGPPAESC